MMILFLNNRNLKHWQMWLYVADLWLSWSCSSRVRTGTIAATGAITWTAYQHPDGSAIHSLLYSAKYMLLEGADFFYFLFLFFLCWCVCGNVRRNVSSSTWPSCTCALILPGSLKYKCFRIVARACNCWFQRNCYIWFSHNKSTSAAETIQRTWWETLASLDNCGRQI